MLPTEHDWVAQAPTPQEAKRRGKLVRCRADWDTIRVEIMLAVLRAKFAPGTRLAARLEATGQIPLEEGNTWGDTFWGVCRGRGLNWLGRLLTRVRADNRRIAA